METWFKSMYSSFFTELSLVIKDKGKKILTTSVNYDLLIVQEKRIQ